MRQPRRAYEQGCQQTSVPRQGLQKVRFALRQGVKLAWAAVCGSSRSAAEKWCSWRDFLGGHKQKADLDQAHLLPSSIPEQCFTKERDDVLHWVNTQSMDGSRNMAYFTDNSHLSWAGQWIQINCARSNQKRWVHSNPHQASTDETNSYKLCPCRRSVECRINVINGLWYIKTGADEGVKYGCLLNSWEIREFSPRSNLRKTERELSTIWYTITKAVLTSWKPVLSISRYYVLIS